MATHPYRQGQVFVGRYGWNGEPVFFVAVADGEKRITLCPIHKRVVDFVSRDAPYNQNTSTWFVPFEPPYGQLTRAMRVTPKLGTDGKWHMQQGKHMWWEPWDGSPVQHDEYPD